MTLCHTLPVRRRVNTYKKKCTSRKKETDRYKETKVRIDWGRYIDTKKLRGGCPRGVMVKALDCGIVVREFVLQSRYYVHFRENTIGKGMSPLILPAMG